MRKSTILVLVAALGVAAPVRAQIDPDPDSCGIYFDEGATEFCTSQSQGGQQTAYLCLTRTAAAAGVAFWEAAVEVSDPATVLAWSLRGAGTNALAPPQFAFTPDTPLPWQSSLVVLEVTVEILTPHPLAFRVRPLDTPSVPPAPYALPAYEPADDPGNLRTLGYSFGLEAGTGEPHWCAVINSHDDCAGDPTAEAATSWGRVKGLYR